LAVGQGEIVAIIGPNGAGKTTIFNIITGVYPPTRGAVWFRERAIHGLPPHRIAAFGLSRTFQNLQVFRSLSVVENVMVGFHMRARSGFLESALPLPRPRREERWALDRSLQCLEVVGLAGAAFDPATSLPFGQQKLLEIARAVATDPQFLLLDEPAAGLSPAEAEELIRLVGRLRDGGMTILLVEHDMNLVMRVSDRVVVLNYGQKIAEGTPAEVRDDERVIQVYLGTD
jgi:branched-chain amino acid transport system ATP-binding protein